MSLNRIVGLPLLLLVFATFATPTPAHCQDSKEYRGRKYKAPPETSHIVVHVAKNSNGKPIANAAVVFNPTKDGKDIGSLEIKTDPDGNATIDVIPTGSMVRVQVIANGFATYAEDFLISESSRDIAVKMLRPQEQISAYVNNEGKPSERKPGVQEPVKPSAKPAASPASVPPASASPTAPKQ